MFVIKQSSGFRTTRHLRSIAASATQNNMSRKTPKDPFMGPIDEKPSADSKSDAEPPSKGEEIHNMEPAEDSDPSKNKTWSGAAGTWLKENPRTAVAIGAGTLICAAPVIATAPALAAAGFGAQGVGAGTAAAAWQAGIGNAVAPSVFATLQSAGAAGYGAAAVNGVASAAGGATAAAGFLKAAWGRGKGKGEEGKDAKGNKTDEGKKTG